MNRHDKLDLWHVAVCAQFIYYSKMNFQSTLICGPLHQYIFNVYMKYRSQYEIVTDPITVGQKTSLHFVGVFRIAMIKSTTVWF